MSRPSSTGHLSPDSGRLRGGLRPSTSSGALPGLGPDDRKSLRAAGLGRSRSEALLPAAGGSPKKAQTTGGQTPTRRRSLMATRNLALGDPRTERALPSLQARLMQPAWQQKGRPKQSDAWLPAKHLKQGRLSTVGVWEKSPDRSGFSRLPLAWPSEKAFSPRREQPIIGSISGLRDICVIAGNVAEDMNRVIDTCMTVSDAYANDATYLQEISSTTQGVLPDLVAAQNIYTTLRRSSAAGAPGSPKSPGLPGSPKSPGSPAAAPAPYDDPHLARARKVVEITNKLCVDLDSTSHNFGVGNREAAEAASLQAITKVTRQVCQEMSQLQGESWAHGVVLTPREDQGQPSAGSSPRSQKAERENQHSEDGEAGHELQDTQSTLLNQPAVILSQVPGLIDVEELLAQSEDELSAKELEKIQQAFSRFKIPDSSDLHVQDVQGLLEYLGHVMTAQEGVDQVTREITTFDYLDFDEFICLKERFIAYENEQFRKAFDKFDEDGSGGMSVNELKALLQDIHFIPLHYMIMEALAYVDQNDDGELDFNELMKFLKVYRRAEGFSTHEAMEFRRNFDFFSQQAGAPPGTLPADQLSDALVQSFGLHVSDFAQDLEAKVASGEGLQKSSFSTSPSHGGAKAEGISFPEFLIFARKTREASLEKLKSEFPAFSGYDFEAFDTDGSGGISMSELRSWLQSLGYTPLNQNLQDIFNEVDKDDSSELDFCELFDFMMIYLQREGFRKEAVEDMRKTFQRFDDDGSGEISALELADLFRDLGYTCSLDQLHVYVSKVDANGSNQLDFREYLRLMRLHREEELRAILLVFDRFRDPNSEVLNSGRVRAALEGLGHDLPKGTWKNPRDLDFDEFVKLADARRLDHVTKERKKAGFPDEQVEHFREIYTRFDADNSGSIDTIELMAVLREFDWAPKTREEQQSLMKKLDLARAKARYAGVKNVGKDGSGTISFWTFIQLSRMLETEHEVAEEARMNKLMSELKFTVKEVEEFREIFLEKKQACVQELELDAMPRGLPRDAIRRLMNALGISVKGERRVALDEELESLGCTAEDELDFAGFLRLMRWLMESGWLGKGK